jgi:quinol-cytochrome oxidoreductase complex cytochrome b subunit
VGDQVKALLLGSPTVGQPALIRFYNLHVFILSFAMVIVLGIHFWRVRKDGGISGPPPGEEE